VCRVGKLYHPWEDALAVITSLTETTILKFMLLVEPVSLRNYDDVAPTHSLETAVKGYDSRICVPGEDCQIGIGEGV